MAKTIKEERLRWVEPVAKGRIKLGEVVKVCPYSQRSLERWLATYRLQATLEPRSTRPRTNSHETPIRVRERVIELRTEHRLCAWKLRLLLKEEGIYLHERTIGKILKQAGLTRRYRVRKIVYKYVKATLKQGELMEIDVKYVPGEVAGQRYFQYTAIDCASRWRHLEIYDAQTSHHSILFLEEVMRRFPHSIQAIKTDNGAIFTNRYCGWTHSLSPLGGHPHALDVFCAEQGIKHFLIDPGKPAQNGKVERSHREDQEKFYEQATFKTLNELRYKLRLWNMYYNNLPHCGLDGRTPHQMLGLIR